MKKVFSIIICGAVVAGFTSCKNEEEDIFGESSALRLNHAVATYDDLLTSAENGWVMEYFANEEEQGYPMLVKFDKSGAVTFAAKNHYSSNDVYATEESLYEVIADNGPVLSFNSYNTLFHIFADPADNPETGTEDNPIDETGVGHEGDYEFVIYEGDADHFRMKGKKHGLEINMYKLPADQAWDTYYDKLDEIKAQMFSKFVPTIWMSVGSERYYITGMSDGLFNFVPEGGDPVAQTVTTPFIVRLDGTVHLCTPFEGENENLAIQNFKIGESGTLDCVDEGQSASISAPAAGEFFVDYDAANEWEINAESFGGSFVAAYDDVVTDSYDELRQRFNYFRFRYDGEQFSLFFRNGKYNGYFYLTVSATGNDVSLKFEGEANQMGNTHLTRVPAYQTFLDLLSDEYTVTANSVLCPTELTFVSKTDASKTFKVDVK